MPGGKAFYVVVMKTGFPLTMFSNVAGYVGWKTNSSEDHISHKVDY